MATQDATRQTLISAALFLLITFMAVSASAGDRVEGRIAAGNVPNLVDLESRM